MTIKIGVDVGGTNTDAVLLVGDQLVSKRKTTTTDDITSGIVSAINSLIDDSGIQKEKISSINIGTTHLVNAFIQRKQLNPVMVLRLAGQATTALPPCSEWPDDIKKELVKEECYIADGGYEYDGKEIAPINPKQIQWAIQRALDQKIKNVAVSGVFANVNPSQEEEVRQRFFAQAPSINVTCSHMMGGLGLISRENASIVNAASMDLFQRIANAFKNAVKELNLSARVYLTHGDGTKTSLNDNSSTPLKTFHSGPANSISGAGILSNFKEAVTVDIGGTSTDIGLLKDGKPVNENSSFPITGLGVNCNFVLPRLHSFGLGGGTVISYKGKNDITIGPQSVGHQLSEKALVFGGDVLTITDIAVALGRLEIGKLDQQALKKKISSLFSGEDVEEMLSKIDHILHQKLVDGIKYTLASMEEIPSNLVLVGGGASLFDVTRIEKLLPKQFKKVVIPYSGTVANALGAAMSKIGAKFVQVYDYDKTPRHVAIAEATEKAKKLAIFKGAAPMSIVVSEISEVQINYLQGQPHETSITVVGEDSGNNTHRGHLAPKPSFVPVLLESSQEQEPLLNTDKTGFSNMIDVGSVMQGVKLLSPVDVEDIAMGAGLLGSGGGGSPVLGRQLALTAMKKGGKIHTISLKDLPDDAFVAVFGVMGSPVVVDERPPSFKEGQKAIQELEKKYNMRIDAIVLLEGGGMNCSYPLFVASSLNIPVVDADCMGRAFPGIHMVTPNIYGKFKQHHAALSNGRSSTLIESDGEDFGSLERKARKATIGMGGIVSIAYIPMTGKEAKKWTIPGTLSTAQNLGQAVRETNGQPLNQRLDHLNTILGKTDYKKVEKIFEGEITKVISSGKELEGFNIGGFVIKNSVTGEELEVGYQNENLIARNPNTGKAIAEVPELITIIDPNNMQVISCGEYRFGQRVAVLRMSPPKMINTGKALEVVGPKAYPMAQIQKLLDTR